MKHLDFSLIEFVNPIDYDAFEEHFRLAILELHQVSLDHCAIELPYIIRLKHGLQQGIFTILKRSDGPSIYYSFGFYRFFNVKTGEMLPKNKSEWEHQRTVNFVKTLSSYTYERPKVNAFEYGFASFHSNNPEDIESFARNGIRIYREISDRLKMSGILNLEVNKEPLLFKISTFEKLFSPKLIL